MSSEIIEKYKGPGNMLRHCRWEKDYSGVAIFHKDSLVGYIVWSIPEKEIKALEVIKDYRGQGISKELLQIALGEGVSKLSVNKKNLVAISLYESMGFEIYKETPGMWFMEKCASKG